MRKERTMSEMVIKKIRGFKISKERALEITLSVLLALIFGAAIR